MSNGESTPLTSLAALHQLVERQDAEGASRPTRIMVVAFEGWNDAGDAATDALKYIRAQWDSNVINVLESDDFYDFQFTRPHIRQMPDGSRLISWPHTTFAEIQHPDLACDLLVVTSVEPSYRWREFSATIVDQALAWDADYVVLVGALLADAPHTRPIPVNLTSENPYVRSAMRLERPTYQGPVGIVGVLADAAEEAGIPTLSLWAAVPHYVAQPPSPKAGLAIVKALEELLSIQVDLDALSEDALAWERGVNELATDDPEVASYVQHLEEAKDTADLPEASGESIAKEFERYLRKRKDL